MSEESAKQPATERPKTRVVHCQREPFDIYIGRGMRSHPELRAEGWGNPYTVLESGSAEEAIRRYRAWLGRTPRLLARLPELKGKTLGCWCAPLGGLGGDLDGRVCHGQVLAALADAMPDAMPERGAPEEER